MGTRWVIAATCAASVAGVAQAQIAAPRIGGYVQARETYIHEQGVAFTLNRARLSGEMIGQVQVRF